jgi:endonuclease/exonuclease/phosphatase (EEP) superfamily protein YafD
MTVLFLPWMLVLLLVVAVGFAVRRWWRTAGILVLTALLFNWWGHVVPINCLATQSSDGVQNRIKVLAWNIEAGEYDSIKIESLCKIILEQDADLVFLAEDFYACCDQIDARLKSLYPYTTHDHCNDSHYFYSKYPLKHWHWIAKDVDIRSVIIKSCVEKDGVDIDLYGCHLSSNNYVSGISQLHANQISGVRSMLSYVTGISKAQQLREAEIQVICDSLKSSSNPCLCIGDMNDIAGSSTLGMLQDIGFRDAWWEGGCGYGATIHKPLPYRIDYIFYRNGSGNIVLLDITKIDSKGLSDHDAMVATFGIIKN